MTKSIEVRKKELERFDFESFRSLFLESPQGDFSQPDPPAADIRIPSGGFTLGVELTSFSMDSSIGVAGSRTRALDREKERAVLGAQKTWESRELPPVWVNVDWSFRAELSHEIREALVEALVQAVGDHLPEPGAPSYIDYPMGGKELFRLGIASIAVRRLPGLKASCWNSNWSGGIPNIRSAEREIRRLFEQKEPSVPGYRESCDRVWLVVVARCENPSSSLCIVEEDRPFKLTSSFDRGFVLTRGWRQVAELHLVPL